MPDVPQTRMHVILRDPVYRKWFAKAPYLMPHQRDNFPWWLYIQAKEEGPWKRAKIETYAKAYRWVSKNLDIVHDFSITSRRKCFIPPTYRPENGKHKIYWAEYPVSHSWCPYCRRPVIFRYFQKHHADQIPRFFGENGITPQKRCSICGIREEAVIQWVRLGR